MDIISSTEHNTIVSRAVLLLYIVHRSFKHKSLTTTGIIAAFVTGVIHSLPPSSLYLSLLVTFYLTSSRATKFKEEIKAKKTAVPKSTTQVSASQSQRTYVQVLSNSIFASILILLSVFVHDPAIKSLLKAGVIGQYVAVIADTWSSELGILSKSSPILITTFQKVPPGTNGGITKAGILSGLAGSALISAISIITYDEKRLSHFLYFTTLGLFGTLLDSFLGAVFQRTLVNEEGLVLEPIGGVKIDKAVLWAEKDKLKKVSGEDILSNNQVNIMTGLFTTLLSIGLYNFFF